MQKGKNDVLKLLCGPSGTGKSALITEWIRKDILEKKRCFLLVPEQQAYISERDLPAYLPQNAGLYFEVVNFSGLAEDVFSEFGGVTQGTIDQGLRTLLMWDTLRQVSPLLTQYGKSARTDINLSSFMLRTVEELRTNGIEGDLLENTAKLLPTDSSLRKKLTDISLIDAVYREKIESCFGSDPADRLLRMAKLLKEHPYFQNCNLYVDSFTAFSAQEYVVLEQIMQQADTVTVSLCMDDFHSKLPHFEGSVNTAQKLTKLAGRYDIPVDRIRLDTAHREKPQALQIVERDLWRFSVHRESRTLPPENVTDSVRLLRAANRYEEAEAAALSILELAQRGIRFGEIAVVVRDVEAYRGILDSALERYGIPYFLSERTDLASKPLSRLILSALRAVSRNYRDHDVMTLVKTGLAGVDFAEASMFEEYCETWHINGKRFTDPVWSMNPDGLTTERSARADTILSAANRVRKTVIPPLEKLGAALRCSSRLPDRCRALYDYLQSLNISETLSEIAKAELAAGRSREAGESVRLYRFVTETLATLCRVLPHAELSIDEFILALSILFSENDLGSVPNVHDCTVIGSAATLRVENVKASLVLGLCEGEFPATVSDDGILTDSDKAALEEYGICFESRESNRTSEELFYIYRALTKPSRFLYLSTVAMQTDGSAKTPSLAFSRIMFLLDQKPLEFDSDSIKAVLDRPRPIPDENLFYLPRVPDGTTLRLSQSAIRTFLQCPYAYHNIYRLKLREKKDSRPGLADDGTFLHYVYESFLRASLTEDGKLQVPPDEEIEPLANKIAEAYLSSVYPLPPEQLDRHLLHLFARLKQRALLVLRDILGELQNSGFVPAKFEQTIGGQEDNALPSVTLELTNGSRAILTGKIDRVDLYDAPDGKLYVRVIDYKSGTHRFSVDEVRSGMDIQLILYLFAMTAAPSSAYLPAGAQYLYTETEKGKFSIGRSGFWLEDEEIRAASDLTQDHAYTKKLSFFTEEEFQALNDDMTSAVKSVAERILAGEAQKTPSKDACRFCPVKENCDKVCND